MILVPWILNALRGALVFAVATFVLNWAFGSGTISWHILWFGVPSHVLADFAGFCDVVYDPSQKPGVLGPCYMGLVILATVCAFIVGMWAGLLVLVEGVALGVPGGRHQAKRDLART
jgi:hypothetical protein